MAINIDNLKKALEDRRIAMIAKVEKIEKVGAEVFESLSLEEQEREQAKNDFLAALSEAFTHVSSEFSELCDNNSLTEEEIKNIKENYIDLVISIIDNIINPDEKDDNDPDERNDVIERINVNNLRLLERNLTTKPIGKSSSANKLIAALSVFAGCAIIGIGLAGVFLTAGVSLPITLAAGVTLVMSGLGVLFYKKNRNRLSKSCSNLVNLCDTALQKTKVTEYGFTSQHRASWIKGATACTSISVKMAEEILQMSDEVFFRNFPVTSSPTEQQKKQAAEILNSCVDNGIQLNKEVSHGFFNIVQRKNIDEVVEVVNADSGLNELSIKKVGDTHLVDYIGNDNSGVLKDFDNFFYANYESNVFVATATGHTTTFFSRTDDDNGKEYYFLIDSAKDMLSGKMEIYDNLSAAKNVLFTRWGKETNPNKQFAEISVFNNKEPKLK